jgi:hypothetical protein
MENPNPPGDRSQNVPPAAIDPRLPRIYSSNTILFFSIIFAPIFSAVMMTLDLFRVEAKRAGIAVLLLSILYEAGVVWLINLSEKPMTHLTYLLNILGGMILAKVIHPRYFPDEKVFPKRKILGALIVSILITIPFIWAMIVTL